MRKKENKGIFSKITSYLFSINSTALLILILIFFLFVYMEQTLNYRLANAIFGFVIGILFITYSILKTKIRIPLFFGVSFSAFLLWEIFAMFFSRDVGSSIWTFILFISYLLTTILIFSILNETPEKIKQLGIFIVIFGSFILLYDFSNLILSDGLFRGELLSGSFPGHNQFGGFLLLFIPIALGLLFSVKKLFPKIILIALLAISYSGLFYANSRGSWIALILSLSVFLALNLPNIKKHLKILLSLAAAIIFCATVSFLISQNLQKITISESVAPINVSAGIRISVWKDSLSMLMASPIVGFGPGNFGSILNIYESQPWLYSKNAHNYFLEIAVEGGIPALLIFLCIVLSIFFGFFKQKNSVKRLFSLSPILTGFIAGILGSLLHAVIDIDWAGISLFFLFWIFAGVVLANNAKKIITIDGRKNVRPVYLLTLIFVIFMVVLIISSSSFNSSENANSNDEKMNALNTAIIFDPFDEEYYVKGAIAALNSKDWENASLFLEKAQQLDNYDGDVYYLLGYLASQKKNIKQAEDFSRKAISLSPYKNPDYYNQLAVILLKESKTNDAKNILETAVYKRFPLNYNFESYKYIYNQIKLTNSLQETDVLLIKVYDILGEKDKIPGIKKMLHTIESQ